MRHCVGRGREIHVGKTIPPVPHVEQTVLYFQVTFIVFQRVRYRALSLSGRSTERVLFRSAVCKYGFRTVRTKRNACMKTRPFIGYPLVEPSLGFVRPNGVVSRVQMSRRDSDSAVYGLLSCCSRKRAGSIKTQRHCRHPGSLGCPNTQRSASQ